MTSLGFRSVSIHYGRRHVVDAFDVEVAAGEWLCLIGPNGAGKSSLLRAAAGIVAYTGEILVDGAPLCARSARERAELVAFVPQAPQLPVDMAGREYVLLGRNPYVGYFGRETHHDRRMVDELIERLELEELADRPLGNLSGGEQQRLVIARALAQEAPILLLDEPTSSLDIGHQQQALELVDCLRHEHGLTVVSAMHDLTLAGLYADRLALLHRGAIVAAGLAADVLRSDVLAEFYGADVAVHHEPDGTVVVVPRRVRPSTGD